MNIEVNSDYLLDQRMRSLAKRGKPIALALRPLQTAAQKKQAEEFCRQYRIPMRIEFTK